MTANANNALGGSVQYRIALAITASLFLGLAVPAAAQDTSGEAVDRLAELSACREISDPTARLACYDRAAGAIVAANDAGEVKLVSTEDVEQTKRGLFGFSLPKIGLFANEDGELDLLESEITAVRSLGRDSFEFRIAEGSLWRVTNAPSRLRMPKPGDQVALKKAALGSYFVRINGKRGVKGRRVE